MKNIEILEELQKCDTETSKWANIGEMALTDFLDAQLP